MDDDIFYKLNRLFVNPTQESILGIFDVDGYIRMNMIYISPIHLTHFKKFLARYGLIEMFINHTGMGFLFRNFRINFFGSCIITFNPENNKIWSIELSFDPTINENCAVPVMNEIEQYLKECDAFFFMTYFVNIDKEILHNSLADSAEFMMKRNLFKKKS